MDLGDPVDRRHRRWPLAMLGSRLTAIPDREPGPSPGTGRCWRIERDAATGRSGGIGPDAATGRSGGIGPDAATGRSGRGGRARGPVGPWHQVFVGRMAVAARSVSRLRQLLDHPVSLARVRRVSVVVDDWQIPRRGWSGRLGPLPHLLAERVELPRADQGRVLVEIEVRWSVPLRAVLVAVLPLLTPVRPMPRPGSPEVTAQDVLPDWLGAGPNLGVVAGELSDSEDIRPYDIVLRPADAPAGTAGGAPAPSYRTGLTVDRFGVEQSVGAGAEQSTGTGAGASREALLVDLEHAVRPDRYGPFGPAAPRGELTFPAGSDGRMWQLVGPDGVEHTGRLDRPGLPEEILPALAGLGMLDCRSLPGRHPRQEAALLLHLVLAGVPVHAPGLPPACRAYLADELAELLGVPLPERSGGRPDPDAELAWEVRAVRQRRAAMRRHGREFALPRLTGSGFPGLAGLPSVSALLVTRRLAHVLDAVAAIEAQTYPELEIVLCLHGVSLPAELRARLDRRRRPLEIVEVPAGQSFGEAVAAATARARGSLVTKFDDDDTYGPEHVWDLVLARHHSGATLVGKAAEFVYLRALDTTVRRDAGAAESYAPLVAGGTMLIGRGDLEQVGGWRPVPRSVDRGLIERVGRAGGLIYRTHPLGYVYQRRSAGHTWDPGLEYFLRGGGAQWSGLPRQSEFGTAPREEPPPVSAPRGPERPALSTPRGPIRLALSAARGAGLPALSGAGPVGLPGAGTPALFRAVDQRERCQDGQWVTGECRRP